MLFEFLTGVPPFNADTSKQIFENILQRRIPWDDLPSDTSKSGRDLIEKLLNPNQSQRLGSQGAHEVKYHPFFKGVDWENLRSTKASFEPNLEDAEDTSYFDSSQLDNWSESSGTDSSVGSSDDIDKSFSFENLGALHNVTLDKLHQSGSTTPREHHSSSSVGTASSGIIEMENS